MKVIEGKKHIINKSKIVDPEGFITETVEYYQGQSKKVLEHEDRLIKVAKKNPSYLVHAGDVFFVGAPHDGEFNIFTMEYGNRVFEQGYDSLEELSMAITKEFEDFEVLGNPFEGKTPSVDVNVNVEFEPSIEDIRRMFGCED